MNPLPSVTALSLLHFLSFPLTINLSLLSSLHATQPITFSFFLLNPFTPPLSSLLSIPLLPLYFHSPSLLSTFTPPPSSLLSLLLPPLYFSVTFRSPLLSPYFSLPILFPTLSTSFPHLAPFFLSYAATFLFFTLLCYNFFSPFLSPPSSPPSSHPLPHLPPSPLYSLLSSSPHVFLVLSLDFPLPPSSPHPPFHISPPHFFSNCVIPSLILYLHFLVSFSVSIFTYTLSLLLPPPPLTPPPFSLLQAMERSSPLDVTIIDKDESSEQSYHVVDGFIIEDSKRPFPVSHMMIR